MQARSARDEDSFMNSTESRCIHFTQSSRVAICETSHACLRCCWFTANFVGSAGAETSEAFEVSLSLDEIAEEWEMKQTENNIQ